MKRSPVHALMLVVLCISISGCFGDKIKTHTDGNVSYKDDKYVEYSLKTLHTVDIAMDTIFNMLGDLYKEKKITEDQKTKLVQFGQVIRTLMSATKDSIVKYAEAVQINGNITDDKAKLRNNIIMTVKAFYNLRDEAETIYKTVTGHSIHIPDIFLFDTITDVFIKD